jgi:hypothetical protein
MVGCTTSCVAPVYLSTSLVSELTQTSTRRARHASVWNWMQRSFAISSLLHACQRWGWWERTAFWLATLWWHRVRRSCSSTNGNCMHARVNARERWGRARPGRSMMRESSSSMPAYPVCIYTRILTWSKCDLFALNESLSKLSVTFGLSKKYQPVMALWSPYVGWINWNVGHASFVGMFFLDLCWKILRSKIFGN